MLNRLADVLDSLRHQYLTDLSHQPLGILCRLNLSPIKHEHEQPQCADGVTIRLLEQPLREGVNFALYDFRIHPLNAFQPFMIIIGFPHSEPQGPKIMCMTCATISRSFRHLIDSDVYEAIPGGAIWWGT